MPVSQPNTAITLSINFTPGEDTRIFNSNSDSIFTFGSFRLERSFGDNFITGYTQNVNFDSFGTLNNLNINNFNINEPKFVKEGELKLKSNDPYSYVYFGSFYTEIANSINNIITNFPYAILSYDYSTGTTVYDYQENFNHITLARTSTFKIPFSALTNQGNIALNSASTINSFSLVYDYDDFAVQVSGQTNTSATTSVYNILNYNFSSTTNSFLEITVDGYLLSDIDFTGTTSNVPVYIRPTEKRYAQYKQNLKRIERHVLYNGEIMVPNVETDTSSSGITFTWPKTIDGFSPDSYGDSFDTYKNSILAAASNIDLAKTDILIKTVLPENYLELDSENLIYKKITQTYAHQFDEIKNYIDNIAFAHSVTYNGEEDVPNKFFTKLSNLLGWQLSNAFNELDLFEYLISNVGETNNNYAHYNLEVWKRILVNLVWLYKKKGTRDAIQFIFNLLGAPPCLLALDEFVYDIQQTFASSINTATTLNANFNKINENGYIEYSQSTYIFQEGEAGRGNGQRYITQWGPEFDPIKRVDNVKSYTGDTLFYGTENVINSKELNASLDPARAIECNVFSFYKQSGTTWVWSSATPPFSSMTVPFEYLPDPDFVNPPSISAMTLQQYLEFIYSSNIEPKTRKTNNQVHTSWHYPELRKIYLNYYFYTNPTSHRLTFRRLESFLTLLEVQFRDYLMQLIPATTIFESQGTVYRNTVFNRQRFVYKDGINDGSEFQIPLPPNFNPSVVAPILSGTVNGHISSNITPVIVVGTVGDPVSCSFSVFNVSCSIQENTISTQIDAFEIYNDLNPSTSSISYVPLPDQIIHESN